MVNAYQARRDRALKALNQTVGINCLSPQGAFYLYPSCAQLIGKKTPEGKVIACLQDFATYLLENWSVALVPGNAFEHDPHFRISIATADDDLEEGIKRIKQAASGLT